MYLYQSVSISTAILILIIVAIYISTIELAFQVRRVTVHPTTIWRSCIEVINGAKGLAINLNPLMDAK